MERNPRTRAAAKAAGITLGGVVALGALTASPVAADPAASTDDAVKTEIVVAPTATRDDAAEAPRAEHIYIVIDENHH